MTPTRSKRIAVIRCGRLLNQHHVSTLLGYLAECGYSVTLFAIQCPASELEAFRSQHPGIDVSGIGEFAGKGILRFVRGGIALRRHLKESEVDFHYVIDSWTLRYYSVAALLPNYRNPRAVIIYHTFDMLSPGKAGWYERLLERHWAKRADLVVVTDPSRSALMKALYRLDAPPLDLAVRMPRGFRPPGAKALQTFRLSVLPKGVSKLVISPTRLSPERMGIAIIEAFAATSREHALIVYEGGLEYTMICKRTAEKLGVSDRVLILSEASNAEVMLATAASDVALVYHDEATSLGNFFCHPSRLAYCVALGTPIVANDVPSIAAVVYRYGLGACVDLSNKQLFAQTIVDMTSDGGSRDQLRATMASAFAGAFNFEAEGIKLRQAMEALA